MDKETLFPRMSRMERRKQANRNFFANFWVDVKLCAVVLVMFLGFVAVGIMFYLHSSPMAITELFRVGSGAAAAGIMPDGFTASNEIFKMPSSNNLVYKYSKLPAAKSLSALLKPDVPDKSIVVNIPSRSLELYAGARLVKRYPVAVGKPSTPTPLGSYNVLQKEVNPLWYPPNRNLVVPSGPANPLGYRWIGFAPLYGIHGTNAPHEIGTAASNGCVRMYEQDVEELFGAVSQGLPIKITYDLTHITVDGQGQVFVTAFPDIYGYKNDELTLAEIKNKLFQYRLTGFAQEETLRKIVHEHTGQPILFAKIHRLKVNGKALDEWAVAFEGTLLVPVWALAAAFQKDVIWNEYNSTVRSGSQFVSGIVKGDVVYITPDSALALFGGMRLWNTKDNSLDFVMQPLGKKK